MYVNIDIASVGVDVSVDVGADGIVMTPSMRDLNI